MQPAIELRGIGLGLVGHAQGAGRAGFLEEPEVGPSTGSGNVTSGDEQNPCPGAVVFLVLTGGAMGLFGWVRGRDGVVDEGHAGAEDFEAVVGDCNNRGFESDFTGTAVEEERRFGAERITHVLRGRRRELSKAIGAGGGDWQIGGSEESERDGVTGDAQAHRGQSGGGFVGNNWFLGDDERQWAGPIFTRESVGFVGPVGGEFAGLLDGSNVDDERTCGRALLQSVDLANGLSIERIGAQAVDRLGWKDDQASIANDFRGFLDLSGIEHTVRSIVADCETFAKRAEFQLEYGGKEE